MDCGPWTGTCSRVSPDWNGWMWSSRTASWPGRFTKEFMSCCPVSRRSGSNPTRVMPIRSSLSAQMARRSSQYADREEEVAEFARWVRRLAREIPTPESRAPCPGSTHGSTALTSTGLRWSCGSPCPTYISRATRCGRPAFLIRCSMLSRSPPSPTPPPWTWCSLLFPPTLPSRSGGAAAIPALPVRAGGTASFGT